MNTMINPLEDVLIIGAGPAGLAAAMQLQRYGLSPLILERGDPGGLLRNANLVENYPGFPRGITGVDLVDLIYHQARDLGVQIKPETVSRLAWTGGHFEIATAQAVHRARCVVIASGTKPRLFADFIRPTECTDRVVYDLVRLRDLRDAEIAIVGAGDAAFDYALNLAGRNNRVAILNRGKNLKCLPLLWARCQAQSRIRYFERTQIQNVRGLPPRQLEIAAQGAAGIRRFQVDYLIGAMGRVPQLDFVSENLHGNLETLRSQGWLYLIGDVRNGIFRQTSIAVGDGVRAAMQIYQKLKEIKI